jgi:hypothetical protein
LGPEKRETEKGNGGLARNDGIDISVVREITVATARHDFTAWKEQKTEILFLKKWLQNFPCQCIFLISRL